MDKEKPHYLGHRQRLRERFLKSGLEGFADHETVELLLTLAIPRTDVKQPAKELIKRFGSLRGILDAPTDKLSAVPGIGGVAPVALQIIKAAATLYLEQNIEKVQSFTDQEQLEKFWRMKIGGNAVEQFAVAYLDSAYHLIADGAKIHWEGTIDRTAVYPREIIEEALKRKASAIVLAHNHPNGVMRPSEEDKIITQTIVLAAEAVNISVLDHLIVSTDAVFSFRRNMLL